MAIMHNIAILHELNICCIENVHFDYVNFHEKLKDFLCNQHNH